MRILFVSQEMPPDTAWGGIGTYVDVLSEALAAAGGEVHVLSVADGQARSVRRQGDVTVHRRTLPPQRRSAWLPPEARRRTWLAWTNQRLINELGLEPDVIECPEWMAEGLALGVRARSPLVVRLHSSATQLFPFNGQGQQWRGLDGRLAGWLEHRSARRANVVISTRSNLDEVAEGIGLESSALHAIPYPVRLMAPPPIPAGPPVITFVGRLEPRKGPDVLLAAVPAVLAQVPEARFAFVGRDVGDPDARPSSRWMRREADRLGVGHAVELTGGLDSAGVVEALSRSTVCAFPSRWESFGNVVAEAAAAGRPVVSSTIPSFAELVDDGVSGRLVADDSPPAWADAILDVIADPARTAQMGRAGAARIAGISHPDRVAALTLAAYEAAIARWNARRRATDGSP